MKFSGFVEKKTRFNIYIEKNVLIFETLVAKKLLAMQKKKNLEKNVLINQIELRNFLTCEIHVHIFFVHV